MTLTHYIGGKITGDSTDFATLSVNYPNLSTFIDFETFTEYILVAGVWQQIGVPIPPVGGWKEIGRTTLISAGTVIDVPTLDNKKYYMILVDGILASAAGTWNVTLNADTGANYAWRRSNNGTGEATAITQANFPINSLTDALGGTQGFSMGYLANLSTKEKLGIFHCTQPTGTGAALAPNRQEWVNKWVNTSNPINQITITSTSANFNIGSECVVLEWSPEDTHTDNFWEELDSVDLSVGNASSLTSNIFLPKKYMWIQYYMQEVTPTANVFMQVGNGTIDSATNYAYRRSINGASDTTPINQTGFFPSINGNAFANIFVINNVTSEKLFISEGTNAAVAGTANVPDRTELVAKWANTSNQFNIVELSTAGVYGTNSIMKIWGHD